MTELNELKDTLQRQVYQMWKGAGRRGTVAAGTGFGKSRIPCLAIEDMLEAGELEKDDILLVVPTERLRDFMWPEEFKKWGIEEALQYTKRICFASLRKEKQVLVDRNNRPYKLVIFDEFHRITELAAAPLENDEEEALTQFSSDALAEAVIGLTATAPDRDTEPEKYLIMAQVAPIFFSYSLDQGVADGMIADYEIYVIIHEMDDKNKTIEAGSIKKKWMQTERSAYDYMEKMIVMQRIKIQEETDVKKVEKAEKLLFIMQNKRDRFLALLPSKTALAERCVRQISAGGKRTLVFGAGIDQIDFLVGANNTFHSKTDSKAYDRFNAKESHILGVVNAANEGHNFIDLDCALMTRVDSNPRNLIQRTGRTLRIRNGHKARIYLMVTQDTAEERWFRKSIEGFDPSKIKYFKGTNVPA